MIKRIAILYIYSLACACSQPDKLFRLLEAEQTGVQFANTVSEGDSLNILNYVYYYNGGGVALADLNGDGLDDIFFTGNETSCRLYLNEGSLHFRDVTREAGLETRDWCTGVTVTDINGDGRPDLYVCTAGYPDPERRKNKLFVQQELRDGIPVFSDEATARGVADSSYSTQAAFFDFDKDGDQDLYVMNHANQRESVNTPATKKTHGEGASNDHFYVNDGNGRFTEQSLRLGINTEGYGLGLAIGDVNDDGWEDIYVSNDFIYNDLLWINDHGKGFVNLIDSFMNHQSYNGMGCDLADINNDSRLDLIVVDMLPETAEGRKKMIGDLTWSKAELIEQAGYAPQYMRNTLQLAADGRNPGETTFCEIGQMAGIAATDWSWGPLLADFDNDGWKDLFISNGYYRDIGDKDFIDYTNNLFMFRSREETDRQMIPEIRKQKARRLPNRIFRNKGDLSFDPVSYQWGITQPSCSNGAAYSDLDNDGDLDLVVNNLNETAFIYENTTNKKLKNNFLKIKNNNNISISRVRVHAGGHTQEVVAHRERGFMSAVSDVIHFGLGVFAGADSVEITLANGKVQKLYQVASGQTIQVNPAEAKTPVRLEKEAIQTWFSAVKAITGLEYVHHDDPFSDFQYQPLLPHRLTAQGPVMATGDLNGDGIDDCFAGGGKAQPGIIYLQKPEGGFVSRPLEVKAPEGKCTDACIFDANGDGLGDLYLTFGGNEWPGNDSVYQDRLYLNQGNGLLVRAAQALPAMYNPKSCVTATDFDLDGDIDLFVGGYVEPYRYPTATRSYLLENNGGKFTDATDKWSPALKTPGIVTDAVWADMNNDSRPDLVLAGEWMPVSIYQHEGKKFTQSPVRGTQGWWRTLEICDINLDGLPDILAGNCGQNMRYRVSEEKPLILYSADFDGNGSTDPIICIIENGETPIAQRQELMNQLSGIGSRFPRNALYAAATIQDIFGEEKVEKAWKGVCETTQSVCLLNEKNKFRVIPLPYPAQSAPVSDMVTGDFNKDGFPDVIITGNSRTPVPAWGWQDALRGLILAGDGKGSFAPAAARVTGYYTDGTGSSLAMLRESTGRQLLLTGLLNREISIFESKLE